MHSEGKPATGPTVIEKDKSLNDELKITDKCRLSDDSNKQFL
jgi:hypothetical protein